MICRRVVVVAWTAIVVAVPVWLIATGCTGSPSVVALLTSGIGIAVVIAFGVAFESSPLRARELAVIALLGTVSALLRVPFAAIPSLQPSTYLVICSGYVFGPVAGFMVGALTALVSNFFLGHGPWTLFQMVGWGLAGATAPVLRRLSVRTPVLVAFGVLWGVLFGLIVNVWTWVAFVYPLTLGTFMVTWLNSIWFDLIHAVGNGFFLALLGVRTVRVLERYHCRFNWVRLGG
ncbi:MAG TPA: ECF transporter S component [Dehalococcoidia bacterium]|nr:ECF transporter S component [Dehalococcoidia bacterium]